MLIRISMRGFNHPSPVSHKNTRGTYFLALAPFTVALSELGVLRSKDQIRAAGQQKPYLNGSSAKIQSRAGQIFFMQWGESAAAS